MLKRLADTISVLISGLPPVKEEVLQTAESKSLECLYALTRKIGALSSGHESVSDPTFKSPIVVFRTTERFQLLLKSFAIEAVERHEIEFGFGDRFWDWGELTISKGNEILCTASGNLYLGSSWRVQEGDLPKELALFS